jgi:precorrin-6A/cobalt-precorrin-6A reductase
MILLLGGTGESRYLAELLSGQGFDVCLSVFSQAGLEGLPPQLPYRVRCGGLDAAGFGEIFKINAVRAVVDAGHPFATDLHQVAREACQTAGVKYLRYARRETPIVETQGLFRAANYLEAVGLAFACHGNVFLTIGSRNAPPFIREGLRLGRRVIARILPEESSIRECLGAGLGMGDIIAAKGPFSFDFNAAVFKEYAAGVIVSKEAGFGSGQEEKLAAARNLGLPVVLITRPAEALDAVQTPEQLIAQLAIECNIGESPSSGVKTINGCE